MKPVIVAVVLAGMLGQVQENRNITLTDREVSLERIKRDVAEYEFSLSTDPEQKLMRSSAPILRWNNAIRGVDDAVVFIWLSKDRPDVIGTVMSYRGRARELRRSYEFVCLSEHLLTGVRGGQRVWY